MKFIRKYNLEIMSVILLVFCAVTLCLWKSCSVSRRLTAGFMLVYILHEWEEGRFPGGFHKLFFGKLGIAPEAPVCELHLPVAIAILFLVLLPWFFDGCTPLVLMPVCLSLFEGVIHTAGIRLMKMKKPYTPGMATAWLAFAYAVYSIRCLGAEGLLNVPTWVIGILLTIVLFFVMQRFVVRAAGLTYSEAVSRMRKNVLGK